MQSVPQPDIHPVCSTGKTGEVLPVDIAVIKAIRAVEPVSSSESLPLLQALGRIAAQPCLAPINVPPFANSAMDGYAFAAAALAGSKGSWTLPVTGRIVAGCQQDHVLQANSAVRIMTGAPIPAGADTIIMQECCERVGDNLIVKDKPKVGKNIRYPGEDVKMGDELLAANTAFSSRHLALLVASGISHVSVYRKVRVGIISTGSELKQPGEKLRPGQIYNSNRVYLSARLAQPWISLRDYGIVEDDADLIREIVHKASQECDIVITTGGVSAGEEDHMLDVLARGAAELEVLKVAMRPGKPVAVGKLNSTLYFGLPGNPYACAITFLQIAWPAICATSNFEATTPFTQAIADFTYDKSPGRTEYVPVDWKRRDKFGRPITVALGKGASASLYPFAKARAVAVLGPDCATISNGDVIQLMPLNAD